jgi:folate-dependent phosphoribosylglycinamide formyltransferase PurN
MQEKHHDAEAPIRVVLFEGGPVLEPGVRKFIWLLEDHPEIEFLAGFFESEGQTILAVVRDLWRRRGFLAVPLLFRQMMSTVGRSFTQPLSEIKLNRNLARVSERLHFVPDIHDEDVVDSVRTLKPDLGLIYGAPILKAALFDIPGFGTLGIHHGKLPDYRGKKTTFWSMYQGEKSSGVTIQEVNSGLDTGQIVKQGEVPIETRSYRAVWKELETLGLNLYIEAIIEVKRGTARYYPWKGQKGRLYRDPKFRDILMFWWHQWKKRLNIK